MATTTTRTTEATNDYHQVDQERIEVILSQKRPRLTPKYQWKGHLPGKAVFVSKNKKGQKSEIRQNLIQLNEIGPNPASNDCQRRRSPRASIDCQEKEPQSQQCQEVIPNPANIDCREPRGYPRHPGALTCHRDTLKGVTRGQQSAQTQEVTRGLIQIRFLAITSPRRPAGEKEAYFVTPARPVSPNNFQTPIGASSGGQAPPSPHSRRSPSLRPSGGPRPTVIRQV